MVFPMTLLQYYVILYSKKYCTWSSPFRETAPSFRLTIIMHLYAEDTCFDRPTRISGIGRRNDAIVTLDRRMRFVENPAATLPILPSSSSCGTLFCRRLGTSRACKELATYNYYQQNIVLNCDLVVTDENCYSSSRLFIYLSCCMCDTFGGWIVSCDKKVL